MSPAQLASAVGADTPLNSDQAAKVQTEAEYYNATTGQIIAWVNVASLSSSADTVLMTVAEFAEAIA